MATESETEQLKRQCLAYLDDVLNRIDSFDSDVYILGDEHLTSLGIRRAEALDIEEQAVDFGPRFFSPRFTLEQARQKTADFIRDYRDYLGDPDWPKRCRRGSFVDSWEDHPGPHDPEEPHPLCCPEQDAEFRLRWFLDVLGGEYYRSDGDSPNLGVWEGSVWRYRLQCNLVPDSMNNLPGHFADFVRVGTPPRRYVYYAIGAFVIQDPSTELPHIGGAVIDSTEAGEGEVLRSEVAAAVGLLRHQFRRGDFCQNHTLPAIVFSFQHDRFGRVTQFHFDGRSLILRQSRLLDFRSDEPTTDAYHMIRWLANRPIVLASQTGSLGSPGRKLCRVGIHASRGPMPEQRVVVTRRCTKAKLTISSSLDLSFSGARLSGLMTSKCFAASRLDAEEPDAGGDGVLGCFGGVAGRWDACS
ncbi:a219760a-8155-4678-a3fb-aa421457f7b6 [Thermothielavioides terrestris]|uniref:A219760a-8155-4678-a3fb-aa421457f7b6 n=1 Tax=Thermothielavioides terrestris TaxID=2587410 RepID=A0A446BY35_9PEZI|nr:a219760a-8155-4678-a3fb-aa421457f7b6 [Thermothielavioides terrestris]